MRLPLNPPDIVTTWKGVKAEDIGRILGKLVANPPPDESYLHWDELRHRPAPRELSHEHWWLALKVNRQAKYKRLPLLDLHGSNFFVGSTDHAEQLLHEITQRAGGVLGAPDQVTNEQTRDRYLIRNLREEGIASSLIEGASTTRKQAQEMLRSGRKPRSEGEQMVLNNYSAMQYIIQHGDTPLTPELVLDIHTILTRNTLKDPTAAGRFREENERIDIVDPSDNEILHTPPPAQELAKRIKAMCEFANGKTPKGFIHPVVRSVLLHFWLAYDHPFVDGNGRTARALFYWSMLQGGYWLCQFISISNIILKAPVQYARAFLFTETDGNDTTYFLLHQLTVIKKAIDELHRYIDEKVAARRSLERRLHLGQILNERQLDVLAHALRHPSAKYDIKQHEKNFGVVYQTARTDLLGLAEEGLLTITRRGKAFIFVPAPDLEHHLDTLAAK